MKIIKISNCKDLTIRYCNYQTPFGQAVIARTTIGVCYLGFSKAELFDRFKGSTFTEETFEADFTTLHLYGTDFQIEVWQALITIPTAQTITYTTLANIVGRKSAVRAVANAVGRNPVSIIIPCHRVIAANGSLAGFHWGIELKKRILDTEQLGR